MKRVNFHPLNNSDNCAVSFSSRSLDVSVWIRWRRSVFDRLVFSYLEFLCWTPSAFCHRLLGLFV